MKREDEKEWNKQVDERASACNQMDSAVWYTIVKKQRMPSVIILDILL